MMRNGSLSWTEGSWGLGLIGNGRLGEVVDVVERQRLVDKVVDANMWTVPADRMALALRA